MTSEKRETIHLGISPISWRNEDFVEIGQYTDYRHILKEVSLANYEGTEAGSYFPEAKILNKELSVRDIRISGQWFSSFILRDGTKTALKDFENHCSYLSEIHAPFTVLSEQTGSIQRMENKSIFSDKPYFTDLEWNQLCKGLNTFGKVAKKYGVKIAYHPHLGTGIQTEEEVDRLMNHTDPDLVGLLLDTGHAFVSDGSYVSLLEKYKDRIVYLHLKDVYKEKEAIFRKKGFSLKDAIINNLFTVPGQGDIDFDPVFHFLLNTNYQGWVVVDTELNPSKVNSLELAIKAHNFIANKLRLKD